MKNKLLIGLILGITALYGTTTFGQTNGSEKHKVNKVQETHLDLLLNVANANLCGMANSASAGFGKIDSWHTDFDIILNWCYAKIYVLIQTIFHYEWIGVRRQ